MNRTDALFEAIKTKDREAAEELLAGDSALVGARDDSGLSPLLLAMYHRADELVELLLRSGAVPDIHEAAALGDTPRVRELLAADPELVGSHSADGSTPLHLACYFGRVESVRLLLETGADVGAWSANQLRNQPLHAAIAGVREVEIVRILLRAGADVNAVGGGGYTPLHLAGARGDLELIEELVVAGARVSATEARQTPAEVAAERGHADAAARLRALGEG